MLDEPTTGVDPEQRRRPARGPLPRRRTTRRCVLATHQTEDVAALCERVIVVDHGRVRFDGAVRDLVATAQGKVWLADAPTPGALSSWRTGTGRHRNVGASAPPGAELAEPTVEDAYLLLLGEAALDRARGAAGTEEAA